MTEEEIYCKKTQEEYIQATKDLDRMSEAISIAALSCRPPPLVVQKILMKLSDVTNDCALVVESHADNTLRVDDKTLQETANVLRAVHEVMDSLLLHRSLT